MQLDFWKLLKEIDMAKIQYNELIKSMSMFFLDENVDKRFIRERNNFTNLADEMREINHRQGLEEYIRKNDNSIENLLIILGISGEYFKRITSLFRLQRGMEFRTEWSLSTFRKFILTDYEMMEKTLSLFLEADSNKELSAHIPKYRLSMFRITPSVMGRLGNPDVLRLLFAKDLDTPFNNAMTSTKTKALEDILQKICKSLGYTLEKPFNVDVNGNNTRTIPVNYAIIKQDDNLPAFYINFSLNLTTSNGQTVFKNKVKNLRDYIINHNPNGIQIAIIDGAGWVGRQNDLQDIWDYSNFILNLANLHELNNIII